MQNIWTLVGFEWKKIFSRRFSVLFLLMLLLVGFSATGQVMGNEYYKGEVVRSRYEEFHLDKEYSLAQSGRIIDTALLMEVRDSVRVYEEQVTIENELEVFETYIKPYSDFIGILEQFYQVDGYTEIAALTDGELEQFEQVRLERMQEYIDGLPLNETSKEIHLSNVDTITATPLVYGYPDSYILVMVALYASCLFLCFFLALSMSGLFAKECQTRVIALQLTSRYGKRQLYLAKIITALGSSTLIIGSFFAVNFLVCMVVYGPEGWDTLLQVQNDFSPYPLTLLQAVGIYHLVAFCACLFFIAIVIALSVLMKSPFLVLAISMIVALTPIFIRVPETLPSLYRAFNLFFSVGNFEWYAVFSVLSYEIGSFSIQPYVLVPIFHIACTVLLMGLSYPIYRKHQVT